MGAASTKNGKVLVYLGSAAGITKTSAIDAETGADTILTATGGHEFGRQVASADFNGDGYMDVISAEYPIKEVLIFHGSASGIASKSETAEDRKITGSGWSFGVNFRGGDITGDGYADLVISESSYSGTQGRGYIFHATSSGIPIQSYTSADYYYTGVTDNDNFSRAIHSMVDVNGDGYADLIMSAQGYSSSTGRVYIYHGSSDRASSTPDTTLTGEATGHSFGGATLQ